MRSAVLWVVVACISERIRRFKGIYRFHLQGLIVRKTRNLRSLGVLFGSEGGSAMFLRTEISVATVGRIYPLGNDVENDLTCLDPVKKNK